MKSKIDLMTPEELLAHEQAALQKNKEKNNANIQKLTDRVSKANGSEKERLSAVLEVHIAHKEYLDSITFDEQPAGE